MDKLDLSFALEGHLSDHQAADLAGLNLAQFQASLGLAGIVSKTSTRGYGLFDLYRFDLIRRLIALGVGEADFANLPFAARRRLAIARLIVPDGETHDYSEILFAAARLDMADASRLLTEAHQRLGTIAFARDFTPGLMRAAGENWAARRACVSGEHMLTTALRHVFGAISLRQGAPDRTILKILATTPHGDLHELGALSASIIAREIGHDAVFLGPQLPVSEILAAATNLHANVVCIGASSLDPMRLRLQVVQLREVLPPHMLLCLGGPAMAAAGLDALPATIVFSNMHEFATDMDIFARLMVNWRSIA